MIVAAKHAEAPVWGCWVAPWPARCANDDGTSSCKAISGCPANASGCSSDEHHLACLVLRMHVQNISRLLVLWSFCMQLPPLPSDMFLLTCSATAAALPTALTGKLCVRSDRWHSVAEPGNFKRSRSSVKFAAHTIAIAMADKLTGYLARCGIVCFTRYRACVIGDAELVQYVATRHNICRDVWFRNSCGDWFCLRVGTVVLRCVLESCTGTQTSTETIASQLVSTCQISGLCMRVLITGIRACAVQLEAASTTA